MNADGWEPIADRMAAAWAQPALNAQRRNVYFELLCDLQTVDVAAAVDGLLREDRETAPAPGVIRARAVETAIRRQASVKAVSPQSEDEQPRASSPLAGVLGDPSLSRPVEGPFNHRALWGLLLGLLGALGPLVLRAAIRASDADADPPWFWLEALILGVVSLFVSISGLNQARETGRGKGLAIAGIVAGSLALLVAFGGIGNTIQGQD